MNLTALIYPYSIKLMKYERLIVTFLAPEIHTIYNNLAYLLLLDGASLKVVSYAKEIAKIYDSVNAWFGFEPAQIGYPETLRLIRENKLPLFEVEEDQLNFISMVLNYYNRYKISAERTCALINSTGLSNDAKRRVEFVCAPKTDILKAIHIKPYPYYARHEEEIVAEPILN